jgi:hypothetical protein
MEQATIPDVDKTSPTIDVDECSSDEGSSDESSEDQLIKDFHDLCTEISNLANEASDSHHNKRKYSLRDKGTYYTELADRLDELQNDLRSILEEILADEYYELDHAYYKNHAARFLNIK